MTLTVSRADPMEQFVHDLVFEPVAHGTADTGRTDPALLAEDPKSLRYGVFRAPERNGEITDEDPRRPVQDEQDLQPVRVGQEIEALGPRRGVDINQRSRRPLDLCVTIDGIHIWKCKPNRP